MPYGLILSIYGLTIPSTANTVKSTPGSFNRLNTLKNDRAVQRVAMRCPQFSDKVKVTKRTFNRPKLLTTDRAQLRFSLRRFVINILRPKGKQRDVPSYLNADAYNFLKKIRCTNHLLRFMTELLRFMTEGARLI